ncbi:ribose operon repressor [Abditibacteriota bacterium]|nr:ribose operon repressor [Abditibacteriota bacterium]
MVMVTLPPPDITPETLGSLSGVRSEDVPLHLQVQHLLRGAIRDHFEDGQTFWPELLLMEKLGVSRNTVRQALSELSREGLLLQQSTKTRLVSKATTQVGIFLQIYNSDFRADLLHHLARVCHDERGCDFKIFYTTQLDTVLENFLRLGLSEHKIRLLLFDGAKHNLWLHEELNKRGYRTVMIDTCPPGYEGPFVGTDAAEAVHIGVNHLVNLGHRRITLLVNEPSYEETVQAKIAMFEKLVEQEKVTEGQVYLCRSSTTSNAFDLAYNAMDALWSQPTRPTAIFTVSDAGAWGVLKWLGERHVKVPQDVSVLGFEGARPSRFTQPSLSTVAHPIEELAHRAVQMLFEEEVGPEFLPPVLVRRDSTGPVPMAS